MGAHVLQQTRRHARSSRLDAARAAHLRGDAAATGNENDENENVLVATSKSPSQLRRATSLHSRFTLRDLMRAPNAPLAQLRSPLRRADSLANHGSVVAPRNLPAESSDALANPFPPRKNKPATNLKTLLRRRSDDDRGDSETVDPRGGAVDHARGSNATKDGGFDASAAEAARAAAPRESKPPAFPLPKLRVCSRPPAKANETDQPDSPAFVAAIPGDRSRGKRKAATEPEPSASSESFSFFCDETKREKKKSSEASVSALERELAEAIRHEKAAAAAARASMSLGRWRLALETQKARAETAAKTATLTEMLRDQARAFDEDKRSRKEELRGALSRAQALTRELAETNETVEILTEALGAATRERVAAQWRFSAKAATARAEAAEARRKMRRVVVESSCAKDAKMRESNPSADPTTATKADAERHEPLPLEPPHRASLTEALREEIRDELRRELRKEVLKELRKSLRPIVEAEVRAEARDEYERRRDALGSYARMARIGLSVEAYKYTSRVTRVGASTESTSNPSAVTVGDAAFAAPRLSAPRLSAPRLSEKKTTARASLLSDAFSDAFPGSANDANRAAAMMAAARATRNAHYGTKNATEHAQKNGSGSALSSLAMQTVEAAAHARSRLNPLRGANVAELVALHEAAAAKLAQQAEELVHEAERTFFFPSFTHGGGSSTARECAVVEGAMIDVSSRKKKSAEERPSFPPTALTPTTSAKVVVPETSVGGVSQKSEPRGIEPATRTAEAREPSVWDMWFT